MTGILDSLNRVVQRQNTELLFFPFQAIPVVGAVASIPGAVIGLAKVIQKVAQALFSLIRNHFAQTPDNEREYREVLWQDAEDWANITFNQILNLCTAGLLNNVIVPLAYCRGVNQYNQAMQEELNPL